MDLLVEVAAQQLKIRNWKAWIVSFVEGVLIATSSGTIRARLKKINNTILVGLISFYIKSFFSCKVKCNQRINRNVQKSSFVSNMAGKKQSVQVMPMHCGSKRIYEAI